MKYRFSLLMFLVLNFASGGYISCFATDYYISNAGNDSNPGTKTKPWKSIAKANKTALKPGDKLLFAAEESFQGSLIINPASTTSGAKPIMISSYGKGKAALRSGNRDGILVKNLGNIRVSNIKVSGTDRTANNAYGIKIFNEKGDKRLENIIISNCEATGFKWAGIFVGGNPTDLPKVKAIQGSRYGFKNVLIKNTTAYNNMYFGIYVSGQFNSASKEYGNSDVKIIDCVAYDNTGDPAYTENHSGSGIMVDNTAKALIEYCVAYRNGALNAGKTGGPVGIWAHFSDSVTIQYCESYQNKTGGVADGGGFDFDGGVTNSVMQYCYSHDNDGAGYLMWNYDQAPSKLSKNVIRYCISAGDGRKHAYGGIHIGTSGLPITNIDVYNNTIVVSSSDTSSPVGIWIGGGMKNKNFRFLNNVIVTEGKVPVLDIAPSDDFLFAGNVYSNTGNGFLIKYFEKEYKSFEDWRTGTGQENYHHAKTALAANPGIVIPKLNPTVGNPYHLNLLKAFTFPSVLKGVDLQTFGIKAPEKDFKGNKVSLEVAGVGAFQ